MKSIYIAYFLKGLPGNVFSLHKIPKKYLAFQGVAVKLKIHFLQDIFRGLEIIMVYV